MKRDLNLVREILLYAVKNKECGFYENPDFPNYAKEQIAYHVHIMTQAGLVLSENRTTIHDSGPQAILLSVTWNGHEFADSVRDNNLWKKASNTILKEGKAFTFELLKEWLKANLPIS